MSEPAGRGLVQFHQSYDRASGTFGEKRDADMTAGALRSIFDRKFHDFNPLSIVVGGKKPQYWIEMPRIQRHWHPTTTDVVALASECIDCAVLFDEFLTRKS